MVPATASQNTPIIIYQGGANYTTAPGLAKTKPSTIANYPPATTCVGMGTNQTVTISTQLTSSVALSPQDFYTPYTNRYAGLFPGYDGNASSFLMPQELSRLDLDFGSCGPVIIARGSGLPFLMTCDKISMLYVMPMPEITGVSLGQFQVQDVGLTNGSGSGSTLYATEWPFKINRSSVCETVDQNGASNGIIGSNTQCDEVHSIPWFNDLAVVWPTAESVELFQGALTSGPLPGGKTLTSYSFGNTGPAFDPCQVSQNNCSGSAPPFPKASGNSKGGLMAIAASNQAPPATLWAVVPQATGIQGGQALGSLYAYSIAFQTVSPPASASLANIYSWNNGGACPNDPLPLTGWFPPAFTEPTLANGSVYIPMVCGVTDSLQKTYSGCLDVPGPVSGILAFGTCP